MAFSGERYYNIYRIMLTAIGLWPYQTPIIMQMQTVLFLSAYYFVLLSQVFLGPFYINVSLSNFKFVCCMCYYVLQFTIFLRTTCNLEFTFKQLPCIFMTMCGIIMHNSYYFNSKEVSIPCNLIFMSKFIYHREF